MSDTCGCGCGHDHDDHVHEEMEMETLTLTLDDDTEMECGILGVFAVDGIADKEYIALLPLEDETVLLYEYKENEDGIELLNIESDDDFEKVSNTFYDLFDDGRRIIEMQGNRDRTLSLFFVFYSWKRLERRA